MKTILEQLKEHLASITKEEFQKEWEVIEALGMDGPPIEHFVDDIRRSVRMFVQEGGYRYKSQMYGFYGTTEEFSQFIRKYPVTLMVDTPYASGLDTWGWKYRANENFRIT